MTAVSVITPYCNAAHFLPGLVWSLQQQTHHDWECLLIDDQSSDDGPALLERLTIGDPRFHLLALPPRSGVHQRLPAVPRNLGLSRAQGPLVAFLDVDDLWHPLKLERQLAFHRRGHLDLSVTAYGRFQGMEQPAVALRCPPERVSLSRLRRGNPIPLLTVMLRRELLADGFALLPHEDYLQWLNLFRKHSGLRYGCLNEVLACYRLHDSNVSRRQPTLLSWTYRVFRQHGMGRAQALAQLVCWSGSHAGLLLREALQRRRPLPSAATLLNGTPWRLPPSMR